MTETLKPCPFCGLSAHRIEPMGDRLSGGPPHYGPNKVRYVCSSLYGEDHHLCIGAQSFEAEAEAEAIAAWNTRAPDDVADYIERKK